MVIYSRNGHDFSERFPSIVEELRGLPARSAVLDGEIVAAADNNTQLHEMIHQLQFERGEPAGHDRDGWRPCRPPVEHFGCPAVSITEPFEDGLALLRVAEERGLEGVVSKRRDAPYKSGECRDWRKVETISWRQANRERWRLFERKK